MTHDAPLLEGDRTSPVERAAARLRFLLDAGARLDASLDLQETLQTLASIAVPRLGNLCLIDIIGDDDRLQSRMVSHADPDMEARVRSLTRHRPEALDICCDISRTIRSGRTSFNPVLTPGRAELASRDPGPRALLADLQLRSAIAVPITANGRTLGAITICLVGPDSPSYTERDVALVEELGRRASLAVNNFRP